MFDHIARQGDVGLRHALGVFRRGDGTKLLVATQQLGNAQHRFLVPTWDPRVPNLLEAFSQGQTSISLARKGDTQAVVERLQVQSCAVTTANKRGERPADDIEEQDERGAASDSE